MNTAFALALQDGLKQAIQVLASASDVVDFDRVDTHDAHQTAAAARVMEAYAKVGQVLYFHSKAVTAHLERCKSVLRPFALSCAPLGTQWDGPHGLHAVIPDADSPRIPRL